MIRLKLNGTTICPLNAGFLTYRSVSHFQKIYWTKIIYLTYPVNDCDCHLEIYECYILKRQLFAKFLVETYFAHRKIYKIRGNPHRLLWSISVWPTALLFGLRLQSNFSIISNTTANRSTPHIIINQYGYFYFETTVRDMKRT